ncbi:hypothetical protein [Demequina globuliformis]|uniref:hypothetical protein n=1 Tax=Demequina globuliformis TaxID=676202 RepID=UPI000782CC9D|nr:hypothetical protein [Demequina globuliformis]
MPTWQAVAIGIIPSIGVGLVFWFAMRAVVRADRNERAALARADAEAATVADVAPSRGASEADSESSAPR